MDKHKATLRISSETLDQNLSLNLRTASSREGILSKMAPKIGYPLWMVPCKDPFNPRTQPRSGSLVPC